MFSHETFHKRNNSQLQLQRSSTLKSTRITKIFLTHAHGDHTFGLPGLLCLMGSDRERNLPPVDIYGPEGIRQYLRVIVRYSCSRIVPNYRVHELKQVPMAPEWKCVTGRNGNLRFFYGGSRFAQGKGWERGLAGEDPKSWITYCQNGEKSLLKRDESFGEVEGGKDIYPIYNHEMSAHDAPVWEVEDEVGVNVFAAPMSHGVPCVAYVVKEQSKPGKLRPELVTPIILRNSEKLKEAGFSLPIKILGHIKNMKEGEEFKFPDGSVVKQEDVVESRIEGRKIVICGDTTNARAVEVLARDADLLVHEATNTYLPELDLDTSNQVVTKDTITHGHSTPEMAGRFAKKINAKRLVMNHFSSRYKGDSCLESVSIMTRIERQAIEASGLSEENVAAAWDFMNVPIPRKDLN